MPLQTQEHPLSGLVEGFVQGQKISLERKRLAQEEKTQSALTEWRMRQHELDKQKMAQEEALTRGGWGVQKELATTREEAETGRLRESLTTQKEIATGAQTAETARTERQLQTQRDIAAAAQTGETARLNKTLQSSMDIAMMNVQAGLTKSQTDFVQSQLNNFNTTFSNIVTASPESVAPEEKEGYLRRAEKRLAGALRSQGVDPKGILGSYEDLRPGIVMRSRKEILGVPIPGTTTYGVEQIPDINTATDMYKKKRLSTESFLDSVKGFVDSGTLDPVVGSNIIRQIVSDKEWNRVMEKRK